MDRAGGNQAGQVMRKGKKKHAKDELDRQKQAEKKRRRLEKALANSAAIISELEKKKQQKQEEQQRLDDEGAAIAEAVALHVLIGEDCDQPCQLILDNHRRFNHQDDFVDLQPTLGNPSGRLACTSHAQISRLRWTDCGMSSWPFSSWEQLGDFEALCFQGTIPQSDTCPGLVATQALSSLRVRDHSS